MRKLLTLYLIVSCSISHTICLKFFKLVHQAENIVLERFGKFSRILEPGLRFKIPLLDEPRKAHWTGLKEEDHALHRFSYIIERIDLREQVHDLPRQSVITKDNVAMTINAVVYFKIEDAEKAVYGIDNLPLGIEKLAQTTLRNIVGSMTLDDTLVSRDAINTKLCATLGSATEKWGVAVTRVELQEVTPPKDIQHAMEQQMTAERNKRAEITNAEGKKIAAILLAEGQRNSTILLAESEKESSILRAEGQRSSQMLNAEGQAISIKELGKAQRAALEEIKAGIGTGDPSKFILSNEYIKAFAKLLEGQNHKVVILPTEMTGLSSLAAAYLSSSKAIIESDANSEHTQKS